MGSLVSEESREMMEQRDRPSLADMAWVPYMVGLDGMRKEGCLNSALGHLPGMPQAGRVAGIWEEYLCAKSTGPPTCLHSLWTRTSMEWPQHVQKN